MKKFSFLILLALIIGLNARAEAQQQNVAPALTPGFAMHVTFKPPVAITTSVPPQVFLDICGDIQCASVPGAILMRCAEVTNNRHMGGYLTDCIASAALNPTGPNMNLQFLSKEGTLRVRLGNLSSPPFYFSGATATMPPGTYRFLVSPSGTGSLIVRPG